MEPLLSYYVAVPFPARSGSLIGRIGGLMLHAEYFKTKVFPVLRNVLVTLANLRNIHVPHVPLSI